MTTLVNKRSVTEETSARTAEAPQTLQEFPEPRFPAGVAVPPAVLLVVLLGTAGCLTAVGLSHQGSPAVFSGAVVAVAAVAAFAALRGVVVTPVRRLRNDLVGGLVGRQQNGSIRPSRVREVDDIATATRWYGSVSRRAARLRLPLSPSLVVLAVGLLGALALGYLLTGVPTDLSGGIGSRLALVVTGAGAATVLLVFGHLYLITARPLRRLARQAEAIAAARKGADTPEATGPQRLDEVGAIAASLNRFLASITTPTGSAAITAVLSPVRRGRR